MLSLDLNAGFIQDAIRKAEARKARRPAPGREERQSSTGVFREVAGVLEDATVEPAKEMEQGRRLFDEAEGSLIMETLDTPDERVRGFAALAALKRTAGLEPGSCLSEAQNALERLDASLARARGQLELARPGVTGPEVDRDALKRVRQLLQEMRDCESALLRSELGVLEHAAGMDPTATFNAAADVYDAPSPTAFANTLSQVAARKARCGLDAEPLFRKAQMLLTVSEPDLESRVDALATFVGHRAEAGQFDRAREELARLAAGGDRSTMRAVIRARGLLGAALARSGDLRAAQGELALVPRTPDATVASEAIEALATVSRALVERRLSNAARSVLDAALLLLKQLRETGEAYLEESAVEALAVALASCGVIAEARDFAASAGSLSLHARVEVDLAIARAGAALLEEARKPR